MSDYRIGTKVTIRPEMMEQWWAETMVREKEVPAFYIKEIEHLPSGIDYVKVAYGIKSNGKVASFTFLSSDISKWFFIGATFKITLNTKRSYV